MSQHANDFPISWVLKQIRKANRPFPQAAMQELRDQGYGAPFHQLVGCVLSIRTYDEVSLPASLRLLKRASSADQMRQLKSQEILGLIQPCSFAEQKAQRLKLIAQKVWEEFGGELPCDFDYLISLPGVGPKCAGLTLGIACELPYISVDVHVHRITNRWGYVQSSSPEKTLAQLQQRLPQKHWIEINELLVPFGKHICTGRAPKCATCPVREPCAQIGVTTIRRDQARP